MGTSATTALAALMELLPSADNPADAGGEQAPVERIRRPATDPARSGRRKKHLKPVWANLVPRPPLSAGAVVLGEVVLDRENRRRHVCAHQEGNPRCGRISKCA